MEDGLKTFPFPVKLDDRIALIEAEFGINGYAVVWKLHQAIFSRGYYLKWDADAQLLFLRDYCLSEVGKNAVCEIVASCIRREVFESSLYEKYGILTSRQIQETFLTARVRSKKVVIEKDYALSVVYDFIENASKNGKNVNIFFKNADTLEQRKEKEKKEKNRKEKDNVPPNACTHEEDDFLGLGNEVTQLNANATKGSTLDGNATKGVTQRYGNATKAIPQQNGNADEVDPMLNGDTDEDMPQRNGNTYQREPSFKGSIAGYDPPLYGNANEGEVTLYGNSYEGDETSEIVEGNDTGQGVKGVKSVKSDKVDVALKAFCERFGIQVDGYDSRVYDIDFAALSKAYEESPDWLQQTGCCKFLRWICKNYQQIIAGKYKTRPKKNAPKESEFIWSSLRL